MTRAELREAEIIALGRTPGSVRGLPVGTPSTTDPRPIIAEYNWSLDEAVRKINRRAFPDSSGAQKSITVSAQTASGPYLLDTSAAIAGVWTAGEVTDIYDAWWQDATGGRLHLNHTTADTIRSDRSDIYNEVPSTPTFLWMDGQTLNLFPAPAAAGTLQVITRFCLPLLSSDTDSCSALPEAYHSTIWQLGALLLAGLYPNDTEMQNRIAVLTPESEESLLDVMRWQREREAGPTPTVRVFAYRR
jgi:hypothetical protein